MTWNARLCLIVLLLVAAGLRLWNFPRATEVRDGDELNYLEGGPSVLEGLMPGNKAAPGGPMVWITWTYSAAKTGYHLLRPGPEERAVPFKLRPLVALDHALFDIERDITPMRNLVLWIFFAVALVGVWAAFQLGYLRAGLPGGLLAGGLFAVAPIVVDFSNQTRPYILAWTFGILAVLVAASANGTRRWLWSGIFLGLAIGSRIDMLVVTPLVLWEFLYRREAGTSVVKASLAVLLATAVAALLCAPWLLTGLIHNVRMIVMVGASTPQKPPLPWYAMLGVAGWENGLGLALVIFLAGLILLARNKQWLALLAGVFVLLMLASILKDDGYGIRHKASSVIALIMVSGLALSPLLALPNRQKVVVGIVAAALVLPLFQSVRTILGNRASYAYDGSVPWIEEHIPAGTRLYVIGHSIMARKPLPTAQSAEHLWSLVMAPRAYETKFDVALARYQMQLPSYPHAFSEETVLCDRMSWRAWWLLGSRASLPIPRYDVALPRGVFAFGIADVPAEFAKTGGVVLVKGDPDPALGSPAASWVSARGTGTFVYVSPDIKAKLNSATSIPSATTSTAAKE